MTLLTLVEFVQCLVYTPMMTTLGIRTHDLSRRAAVGLRLRPYGHWDRPAWSWSVPARILFNRLLLVALFQTNQQNVGRYKSVVISVASLGETRSIDVRVDIADIPWHRARQRDSSLEELWLCWEFRSYVALVMLHTFNYA